MMRNAVLLLMLLACARAGSLAAQVKVDPPESEIERQARLARRGAGVRGGSWRVLSLRETAGGTSATMPTVEAWHQRGLDRHVALDNSIAVWGRRETVTQSGGPLGGSSQQSVGTYIVPLLTSVQLHPLTGPDAPLEPFLRAGAGLALGIETREGSSGSLFGGSAGTTTGIGVAVQAGTGLSWRFSRAFGMTGTGAYRWTHFGEPLGGLREYKGWLVDIGLFYRFQYR